MAVSPWELLFRKSWLYVHCKLSVFIIKYLGPNHCKRCQNLVDSPNTWNAFFFLFLKGRISFMPIFLKSSLCLQWRITKNRYYCDWKLRCRYHLESVLKLSTYVLIMDITKVFWTKMMIACMGPWSSDSIIQQRRRDIWNYKEIRITLPCGVFFLLALCLRAWHYKPKRTSFFLTWWKHRLEVFLRQTQWRYTVWWVGWGHS